MLEYKTVFDVGLWMIPKIKNPAEQWAHISTLCGLWIKFYGQKDR